jgi:type I restriction enzyme R subunit
LLTDIISLVRFALGEVEVLEPYTVSVEEKLRLWLGDKEFNSAQVVWLDKIKEYIAINVRIEPEDLQEIPQEALISCLEMV